MGLAVWTTDQAGPFQTKPYLGHSWQPSGQPQRQAHEYIRNGTAKLLTLFHPGEGGDQLPQYGLASLAAAGVDRDFSRFTPASGDAGTNRKPGPLGVVV